MKTKLVLAATALAVAGAAFAQQGPKPEDAIKWRQSGYSFMAWNMGKIKAQAVEGSVPYDQKQVAAAANVIAAIANSGMGALYGPGTEKSVGHEKTRVKPELFQQKEEVGKLAVAFNQAANNLAKVAAEGDKAKVAEAFGEVGKACKACHQKFRMD